MTHLPRQIVGRISEAQSANASQKQSKASRSFLKKRTKKLLSVGVPHPLPS
jgi:hypothetical protein